MQPVEQKRVSINVSGRHYEVDQATFARLRMLYNGKADTGATDEIFVCRAPDLFEKVLGFLSHPDYPYPRNLAFELDYYDVEYDPSRLFDATREIGQLKKQVEALDNALESQSYFIGVCSMDILSKVTRVICCKQACTATATKGKFYCSEHANLCLRPSCGKESTGNYCKEHEEHGIYCVNCQCTSIRLPGGTHCLRHSFVFKK